MGSLGRTTDPERIESKIVGLPLRAQRPQSVEQGAEIIVAAAQFGPEGPTGAFLDREGTVPW